VLPGRGGWWPVGVVAVVLAGVSKISLRAAFALGRESRVAAQQVFTDRVSEVGAFDASLAALGDSLAAADVSPVVDRRLPRRNVLVYYGRALSGSTRALAGPSMAGRG
jgi:hypothetical protein